MNVKYHLNTRMTNGLPPWIIQYAHRLPEEGDLINFSDNEIESIRKAERLGHNILESGSYKVTGVQMLDNLTLSWQWDIYLEKVYD